MNFFVRAWNGEERLWKVYWLWGVLLGVPLSIIAEFWLDANLENSTYPTYFIFWWCLLYPVVTIAWVVASWRCAYNADRRIWGHIVRFMDVVTVMGAGVLLFSVYILYAQGKDANPEFKLIDLLNIHQKCLISVKQETEEYKNSHPGEWLRRTEQDDLYQACLSSLLLGVQPEKVQAEDSHANPPSPAVNKTPREQCADEMAGFAASQGADPAEYITRNKDYLEKCIQQVEQGVQP